jgi:hypothetical protein
MSKKTHAARAFFSPACNVTAPFFAPLLIYRFQLSILSGMPFAHGELYEKLTDFGREL